MIAVFLTSVYLLFQYYILSWIFVWASSLSPALDSVWFRAPAAVFYLFLAFSPLTGMLVTKNPFHHMFKVIGNLWLGIFLYLLLFVLAFDGIRRLAGYLDFFGYRYPSSIASMPRSLLICGGIILLLLVCIGIRGVQRACKITVRHEFIVLETCCRLPKLDIVLLADLHLGCNSSMKQLQKLVDAVNRENPDLVCIAGDIFDNEYDAISSPERACAILSGIESRYGVYACWGNHDVSEKILAGFTFSSKEKREREHRFEQFLRDAGIFLLEDEVRLIDGAFYLGGRKDPDMARKEQDTRLPVEKLLMSLNRSVPMILMEHQPKELKKAQSAGVDLLLSGHTHNGQMFPANLFLRFFWENPWGILKKGSMISAVTSGACVWGPPMRLGTDNEIMVLHTTFQKPYASGTNIPPDSK